MQTYIQYECEYGGGLWYEHVQLAPEIPVYHRVPLKPRQVLWEPLHQPLHGGDTARLAGPVLLRPPVHLPCNVLTWGVGRGESLVNLLIIGLLQLSRR